MERKGREKGEKRERTEARGGGIMSVEERARPQTL